MKFRAIACALALAWASPALAQTYSVGDANPQRIAVPQVCLDPIRGTPSSCALAALTFTGYQQLTGVSTATGFTPAAGSTVCFIQTETVAVRYRTDGTNPTASVGQTLAVGSTLQETASLATIKFIPTSGSTILDIDCYK